MYTAGTFSQGTAFPDAEIFVSVTDFMASGSTPTNVLAALGAASVPTVANGVAGTITFAASLLPVMLRTGVFAPSTPQTLSGQAFGTAAGLPGPQAAVAGTSSPSGFGIGQENPPVLRANLPTIVGSTSGARKKGVQINWIDFIYQVGAATLTSVNGSLYTLTTPAPGTALTPVTTTIVAATSLSTALPGAGKVNRQRITVTTPLMLTVDGAQDIINLVAVAAGSSQIFFLGAIVGCSYNFN